MTAVRAAFDLDDLRRKQEEALLVNLDAKLLDADGRMRALPAAELARIDPVERFMWCARRARYGLPTLELIEHLHGLIRGRRAIEIGAGQGDLGRLLGIPMTDSAEQCTNAEMAYYYASIGHAPTKPPADVERISACDAVAKYKPEVVVASWVTQLFVAGDERARVGSSVFGVDELALLRAVPVYLHIGSEKSHRDKRALALPHREVHAPWLISRSFDSTNFLAIWGDA